MISRWIKKSAFCLFSTVIYQSEDPSPRLNGVEIFMLRFVLEFFLIALFFQKKDFFMESNKSEEKRFRDYHNIYFRILLAILSDKNEASNNIYIQFFCSFDMLALRCNFAWKKECTFGNNKAAAIEKQFIAFSIHNLQSGIFELFFCFGGYA